MKPFKFFFFISTFLCLVGIGCAVVPVTGRRQLSLVSSSELLPLSATSYQKVLTESQLSQDSSSLQLVTDVGKRIAQAAEAFLAENGRAEEIKDYQWEFHVIEEAKTVNAFCMPGGKIAVYTGILPLTQNAEGLAVVMGHEVAHAIANHGGERLSQQLLFQMGGQKLSEALRNQPAKTQQTWMRVYGIGANVGVLLPYSRLHESEADRIGLILMARAGFDPNASIPFWERMSQAGGAGPIAFLSTHPAPVQRIEALRAALPEALTYYKKTS